jgi:Uma2 family endonuclease
MTTMLADMTRVERVQGVEFPLVKNSSAHDQIISNIANVLDNAGGRNETVNFLRESALHAKVDGKENIYFPDLMLLGERSGQDEPSVIIEVASLKTARVDRVEKRLAYPEIMSMEEYVVVFEDEPTVFRFRRRNHWLQEAVKGLEAELQIGTSGLSLALSHVYRGVEFA